MRTTLSAVFILLCLLKFNIATSQTGSSGDLPAAILVQINTETNRINALTKDNKQGLLSIVIKDRDNERTAMTADFNDHFNKCPVYYFADTNQKLVVEKKFDHVLLNADGSEAKNVNLDGVGKSYLIAYYGEPVNQFGRKTVTDTSAYIYNENAFHGKGLVICNAEMKQVNAYVKYGWTSVSKKSKNYKYFYRSKKFEIEYYPLARTFNREVCNIFNFHKND